MNWICSWASKKKFVISAKICHFSLLWKKRKKIDCDFSVKVNCERWNSGTFHITNKKMDFSGTNSINMKPFLGGYPFQGKNNTQIQMSQIHIIRISLNWNMKCRSCMAKCLDTMISIVCQKLQLNNIKTYFLFHQPDKNAFALIPIQSNSIQFNTFALFYRPIQSKTFCWTLDIDQNHLARRYITSQFVTGATRSSHAIYHLTYNFKCSRQSSHWPPHFHSHEPFYFVLLLKPTVSKSNGNNNNQISTNCTKLPFYFPCKIYRYIVDVDVAITNWMFFLFFLLVFRSGSC